MASIEPRAPRLLNILEATVIANVLVIPVAIIVGWLTSSAGYVLVVFFIGLLPTMYAVAGINGLIYRRRTTSRAA